MYVTKAVVEVKDLDQCIGIPCVFGCDRLLVTHMTRSWYVLHSVEPSDIVPFVCISEAADLIIIDILACIFIMKVYYIKK